MITEKKMQAEFDYAAAMLLARDMHRAGAIDARDFSKLEHYFSEKYAPPLPIKFADEKAAIA
ncbi:MAG: hypothetical protein LBJ11_05485 [Oscillospiraceae bacterium]|jgi:hypothetical protein|nr:hypothetical protein [Oscillospiraceae bacterium]